MNILYLSEPDPRMTHFGGAQRTNYIWRALQELGNVYTMTFDQRFKTEEVAPRLWYVKKLQKVNPVRDFFYKIQTKVFKTFRVLYCFPLSTKIEKTADEIFPNVKFDVVVCRYLDVLGEMHLWGHPRLIVDVDDDPLQMYDTVKSQAVHSWLRPLGRWILQIQVRFLEKRIAGGWLSNASQVDCMHFRRGVFALRNIAKSPTEKYQYTSQRNPVMIIVGSLSYLPNYAGITEFLDSVWLEFHKKYPNIKLQIVGGGTFPQYERLWNQYPNVEQLGFVKDIELVYQNCLCSIVPIYLGGGTCIKTRESMSFGRVCLSSPFGARGLEDCFLSKNTGLQVFRSAEEFIQKFESYVLDENKRSIAEKEAVSYITTTHLENSFFQVVRETVEKICETE